MDLTVVAGRAEGEKVTRIPATDYAEDGIIVAEGFTKHFMYHAEATPPRT